MSMAIDVAIVP